MTSVSSFPDCILFEEGFRAFGSEAEIQNYTLCFVVCCGLGALLIARNSALLTVVRRLILRTNVNGQPG